MYTYRWKHIYKHTHTSIQQNILFKEDFKKKLMSTCFKKKIVKYRSVTLK